MSRLHEDRVEVRTQATPAGPEPEQFLWRGRHYVVREVLARWTSAGAWWQHRASCDGDQEQQTVDDGEREWWRVLASRRSELTEEASDGRAVTAGRQGQLGTYDLCFSWSSGWALRRVID